MGNSLEANAYYKRQADYAKLAFQKNNLMPRRYVLILTNLCNLACWFCVQERKKKADFMKGDEWLDVISQIPKNSRITMTGGEPMVFKNFNNIFAKANEFCETNIISNGLLLYNEKIEISDFMIFLLNFSKTIWNCVPEVDAARWVWSEDR